MNCITLASGDKIHEPLLDVGDTSLFHPALVSGSGGGANTPPTARIDSPTNGASFTTGTSIAFSGSATDTEDGNLTGSLVWTSNIDGPIGTGGAFSMALSQGTHLITASATDSGGLTGSAEITVVVEPAGGGVISLSVKAYKITSSKYADLTWSGATMPNVDVYRSGRLVVTTANDGAYTDKPPKSLTSATYKVCEAGTGNCSAEVTVAW